LAIYHLRVKNILNFKKILKVASTTVNGLAAVLALYSLYLLLNGQIISIVQESAIEEINNGVQNITIDREPYPAAILPLIASLMLMIGNMRKKQGLAWIGLAILLLFSLIFLFSSGATFLPVALLLLILLLIISFVQKRETV